MNSDPNSSLSPHSSPLIQVAIGLIWRDGKLLIARRPEGEPLGGLWEFPGGKRRPGEGLEDCLRREIREEMGIEVRVLRAWDPIEYSYPEFDVVLYAFECQLDSGEPQAGDGRETAWVQPGDLSDFPFPPANKSLLAQLRSAACG